MSKVKRYKNQRLLIDNTDLEVEDCEVVGNGNIIQGKGIRVSGNDNVILGQWIKISGKRNQIISEEEETRTSTKRKVEDEKESHHKKSKTKEADEDTPFLNTKALLEKSVREDDSDEDEKPELWMGPSGILLIPMKGKELAKVEANENKDMECIMCRVYKKSVFMQPCGHACVCIPCSRKIGLTSEEPRCPVCKGVIAEFLPMHI